MDKVLVTGGTGFIGSNLIKGLLEKKYSVRVFDNNFRGNLSNIEQVAKHVEFVQGDIRNFEDVMKAVDGVNLIYHLAFINGTENFYKHPDLVIDVGIKGILNIIDAIKNKTVESLIYASSSEIYQEPGIIPTPEEVKGIIPDVRNPRYSYGGSKLMGEIITLHYFKTTKTKRIIFRPHNFYGPSMGFEHVIPQIIKKIVIATNKFRKSEAKIEIQGTGDETRAFCYITDGVDGIIRAAEYGEDKNIYNVGIKKETKIIDLVQLIAKFLNVKLSIKNTKLQYGSPTRRCPDISKLEKIGYKPSVSLKEGLLSKIDWYKKYYLNNL